MLIAIIYSRGRLSKVLVGFQTVGWVQAYAQSWLIQALSDAGRIQEAVELYEAVRARGLDNTSLHAVVGPRVLIAAGGREEALETIRRGRQRAREEGTLTYELLTGIEEARLRLRIDRDPAAALAALDPVDRHPVTHRFAWVGPQVDSFYGLALLLQGRDAEALERLRRSAAADLRVDRWQDTPATAVWLAEAEWRAGNEEAADRAADLALEAARRQGFNHILLQALRDFPAVLSRRLDAEPAAGSPWHELARALHAQQVAVQVPASVSVELLEFGRCTILVEGEERTPRIVKTYLLLAYLLTRPHRRAERDELLDVLFEGRADDSARAYLRQAARWLRTVLPPDGVVSGELAATSESVRVEGALAEAARMRGSDRLRATLAALEIIDRGPYLPGIASQWLDERRQRLAELATDARYEAAELAFSAWPRRPNSSPRRSCTSSRSTRRRGAWGERARRRPGRAEGVPALRTGARRGRSEPTATTRQLVGQLRR